MKLLKEIWNFLKYLITGNEECLFEEHSPVDSGIYQVDIRVKPIPFAKTGCVDEHGHEHQLTKVYTCDNCYHPLEIPEDTIQRPLGQAHEISSDVIYGKPTIYNL